MRPEANSAHILKPSTSYPKSASGEPIKSELGGKKKLVQLGEEYGEEDDEESDLSEVGTEID